jgi:alpha-glucosidase
MTKWFEIAAFTPLFRDHSAKDAPHAERWLDGPMHLAIRRHFVEERYRLMPYLYGLAATNAQTGDPIMRPLFYDYPASLSAPCNTSMTFTLGDKLLIAGNPQPEASQAYVICLPEGGWYDYWTGNLVAQRPESGKSYALLNARPTLATLPVFVRAGAILPRQALVQSTAQTPSGPLELHIYTGADCKGEIYDDDGHSMGFARGAYARQTITCTADARGVHTMVFGKREGSYQPWWHKIALIVHGAPQPSAAAIDGRTLLADHGLIGGARVLIIPDQPGAVTIVLKTN